VVADPSQGYSRDEAIEEASRCLNCQCLECVKVCPYLESYGSYPRKYIRQIHNNLAMDLGNHTANKMINSCRLCGLCAQVCPEHLDMGAVCKRARESMVEKGKMPPSAHDFALRDMQFSNGNLAAMARNEPGTSTSAYAFWPGCQLGGSDPDLVKRVYAYLKSRLSGGVGLILQCCGAPADWAGRRDLREAGISAILDRHRELGEPQLIVACSTCHRMLKAYAPAIDVLSIWSVMDELGLPESAGAGRGRTITLHDACTARHEPGFHQSARNVLLELGYAIEELPLHRETTECCGYGGLMRFVDPALAKEMVRRRISATENPYVVYCTMCRDQFASAGKPTRHLLDMVFRAGGDDQAATKGPGYSERHENRARLKRQLLQEVWGETMSEEGPGRSVVLVVPEEVRETLEERQILREDVRAVIEHAERTGARFVDPSSGHFLAHFKPASVTYWVEYYQSGETFVLVKAYSHRMEIVEEAPQ
jgi:glutamate synthase (NADPH) small chain